MSQELKPCSCCDGGVATHQGGKSVHYLRCNNCEWRTHFYEAWDKAYAEWNNHHPPVPPAGGSLKCWNCKADFTLSERANCDGCCWKCGNEIDLDDYVTRLQAENAALQQRLNEADQRVDDLSARLSEIVGAVKSINRGSAYEVIVPGDDEPQYRQRKEWIDWILQLCEPTTPQ